MKGLLGIVTIVAALAASNGYAQNGNNGAKVGKGGFLLNVNAFERCPAGDFLDSNRHQIAVQANYTGNGLDKTAKVNKIFLKQGDGFWVEDGNACDDGANFYLPITAANCTNCDGAELVEPNFTEYQVRARVLGKPGGEVTITSCLDALVTDPVTGEQTLESLCSVGETNVVVQTRVVGSGKEQNRWVNVSSELLTVCLDTDGDGVCDDRVGLFDVAGQDYWWTWDTQGRPHVQLVFIPLQSAIL